MQRKKIGKFNEIGWLIGIIVLALSICLMSKSGFGVSMVVSPAYIIHLAVVDKLPWYTFGTSGYIFQAVMLIIMCVVIGKFRWRFLLSFATAVISGLVLDVWIAIFGADVAATMPMRIVYYALGLLCSGLSLPLLFRSYMPIEVYDLFVRELIAKFHFKMGVFKWIYDFSLLAIATIITLIVNGNLTGLGIGTLICAFLNSPLIVIFGKLYDRFFTFDPLLPSLYTFINGKDAKGVNDK